MESCEWEEDTCPHPERCPCARKKHLSSIDVGISRQDFVDAFTFLKPQQQAQKSGDVQLFFRNKKTQPDIASGESFDEDDPWSSNSNT